MGEGWEDRPKGCNQLRQNALANACSRDQPIRLVIAEVDIRNVVRPFEEGTALYRLGVAGRRDLGELAS